MRLSSAEHTTGTRTESEDADEHGRVLDCGDGVFVVTAFGFSRRKCPNDSGHKAGTAMDTHAKPATQSPLLEFPQRRLPGLCLRRIFIRWVNAVSARIDNCGRHEHNELLVRPRGRLASEKPAQEGKVAKNGNPVGHTSEIL